MAIVLRGDCDDVDRGTCEKPFYPNWTWRFNRNQHMTLYDPWYIRDEQQPPNYRNMGMHRDFRFHPMGPDDGPRPMMQLGVNYCPERVSGRQAGFGNAALGKSPGPAPPRLFAYGHDTGGELYRVNEIYHISQGMSMKGYQPLPNNWTGETLPLNPSHYLEQTLGQTAEIPGTFPHFNKALPSTSPCPPRQCSASQDSCSTSRDLMQTWRERFARQEARHIIERCCNPPYV